MRERADVGRSFVPLQSSLPSNFTRGHGRCFKTVHATDRPIDGDEARPRASQAGAAYGWVVVGVSATVNSLAWSVRSTFALFYVALLGEFGWRRGEAALGYSLSWLLLLLFSPLSGRLFDRWGARLLVPVGGLVLGGALALTGQTQTLWQYYLAFGVLGAAGIGCIQTLAAAIVNRWSAPAPPPVPSSSIR